MVNKIASLLMAAILLSQTAWAELRITFDEKMNAMVDDKTTKELVGSLYDMIINNKTGRSGHNLYAYSVSDKEIFTFKIIAINNNHNQIKQLHELLTDGYTAKLKYRLKDSNDFLTIIIYKNGIYEMEINCMLEDMT